MELVRHNLKHVWELTISETTMGIETRDVEEDIFRFIVLNHHQLYTKYKMREMRYLRR